MKSDNNQKHYVFIIGTRAQLIKVAPVIVECERKNLQCTLLMTGQHVETMQDLLDEFGVTSRQVPAIKAKERATVLSLIAWLPYAYHSIVKSLKSLPAAPNNIDVLVHGDTLSTVLGALAGRHIGARVIHLESGLTSNKIFDPFPEEISRRIVFRLSHVAMCPNQETLDHMTTKYPKCKAFDTDGNTILDAIRLTGVSRNKSSSEQPYIVVSLHRFQNIYDAKRLSKLVELLEDIAKSHMIKFVLHPATRKRLVKQGLIQHLKKVENLQLIPRLGYSAFLQLAAGSACVLTDGGSNQEELAALGTPTIVMRHTTERSDGLGKNTIMEGHLIEGVGQYLRQQHYKSLESSPTILHCQSPSTNIVNCLVRT